MSNQTYKVKRYVSGANGIGMEMASNLETLEEAVEIVFRLTRLQEQLGGNDEFTILPED